MDSVGGCSRAAKSVTGGSAAGGRALVVYAGVDEIKSERIGVGVVARKADRGKKCGPSSLASWTSEAKEGFTSHWKESGT
jgi:hypothetical protein